MSFFSKPVNDFWYEPVVVNSNVGVTSTRVVDDDIRVTLDERRWAEVVHLVSHARLLHVNFSGS